MSEKDDPTQEIPFPDGWEEEAGDQNQAEVDAQAVPMENCTSHEPDSDSKDDLFATGYKHKLNRNKEEAEETKAANSDDVLIDQAILAQEQALEKNQPGSIVVSTDFSGTLL